VKESKIRSAVSSLVSAAAAVGLSALLPIYWPWHYLMVAAFSAGLGMACGRLCKDKTVKEPAQKTEKTADDDKLLIALGREQIRDLHRLDSLIDDEKISEQIRQMESIAGSIFDYVDVHREKLHDIRRFMNYYLPTSIKLLRTYDDLSVQGVDGKNINGTMRSIEEVMDTIVLAYQKQLDSLFADSAMDISTDIAVLEGFMASEGIKK